MQIDVSNTPSMYTITVSGSFTFDRTCGVRNDPNMATATVADYTAGQIVNYNSKVYNDGHFWAPYISASDVRRYVDYANTTTGEFFGTDTNSTEPVVPVDDTGKHLPIHELSPYNYDCVDDARTDVKDWEKLSPSRTLIRKFCQVRLLMK
ncbi:SH3 domain-containing protein [Secundilactobacillus folii]|uniref:SH3b domain-containing protein n=1 Tax=Secundilactobacillus folii TaxID=2678357 RepID=A0A7X3C2G4_9LACO|nr:SH3 domain-containing protein [Secundilactobacillus folii]MTV81777.1 hypothetical protein [Secundilactobacillus folii]